MYQDWTVTGQLSANMLSLQPALLAAQKNIRKVNLGATGKRNSPLLPKRARDFLAWAIAQAIMEQPS
jgi:hypothetical protein